MTNEEKEQKAILCIRSLSNISKDLRVLDLEIFSNLCLFIANGLLQIYRKPEMPVGQVHGNTPHNTDIKNEILSVVKEVKAGFTQKEPKSNLVPEGGHLLKNLRENYKPKNDAGGCDEIVNPGESG